jgi:hypothetical protein
MRVVRVGEVVGRAPLGRQATPVPLVWPNKDMGATLDYVADYSAMLAGNGVPDQIQSVSVAVLPASTPALVVGSPASDGQQVTLDISGGIGGQEYLVTVTASFTSGRIIPAPIRLYIWPAPCVADLVAPGSGSGGVPTIYNANIISGNYLLGATVSGGMGVMTVSNGVVPANADTVTEARSFLGIAQQAGNAGSEVSVVSFGPAYDTGWSWIAEEPIFLADAGALTQTPPQTGVALVVGFPLSATEMFVRPLSPIQL